VKKRIDDAYEQTVEFDAVIQQTQELLDDVQATMYAKALQERDNCLAQAQPPLDIP